MIPRYTKPDMARLWSDEHRYELWACVEVVVAEAQAERGRIPAAALADIQGAPAPSPERVEAHERERDHEVLSFLTAYCEGMPADSARWVHLGMTSYDLVDTALGFTLAGATDLMLGAARRLRRALVRRALEQWGTVCIGRTHGVHAEPTTFGHRLAGFAFAVDRSVQRLVAARSAVAVGTISGSVGTYALIDPAVERFVCDRLGLGIEPVPSQVVARDRHAQLIQAVATLGACVEQLALELRLLQQTEVREVEERRTVAYQGSSAMPHKRNPTTSERLCGLARILRGHVTATLEDVALWHERDLSHSSVERIVLPDALTIGHYQTTLAAELVEELEVFPQRMREVVQQTRGRVFSSAVLADSLAEGLDRETAYRAIQAASDRSARSGASFAACLEQEGVDVGPLDVQRFLLNHGVILERVEALRDLED